jgi:hypothetical protein
MRHLVGIGTVIIAFAVRFWLQNRALDISIHDTYRVFPLNVVVGDCVPAAPRCRMEICSSPFLIYVSP